MIRCDNDINDMKKFFISVGLIAAGTASLYLRSVKSKFLSITVGFLLGAAAVSFSATIAGDPYYTTQTGDWRYGYYSSGTNFVQMNYFHTDTVGYQRQIWTTTDPGIDNGTGNPGILLSPYGPTPLDWGFVNPGDLYFHPGTGVDAVIRYITPSAGDYTVNATFTALNSGGRSYSIRAGTTVTSPNPGDAVPVTVFLPGLAAHTYIDFVVNNGGSYINDAGKVSGTIEYDSGVPEPSTILLVLAGATGLGALRRKRES